MKIYSFEGPLQRKMNPQDSPPVSTATPAASSLALSATSPINTSHSYVVRLRSPATHLFHLEIETVTFWTLLSPAHSIYRETLRHHGDRNDRLPSFPLPLPRDKRDIKESWDGMTAVVAEARRNRRAPREFQLPRCREDLAARQKEVGETRFGGFRVYPGSDSRRMKGEMDC